VLLNVHADGRVICERPGGVGRTRREIARGENMSAKVKSLANTRATQQPRTGVRARSEGQAAPSGAPRVGIEMVPKRTARGALEANELWVEPARAREVEELDAAQRHVQHCPRAAANGDSE